MEESADELQSHHQPQAAPQPPQNVNFHQLALEQVRQWGPGLDPAQSQLATFPATLQIKAEHEARLARHLLEKTLSNTVQTVSSHTADISQLKVTVSDVQAGQADLQHNQHDIYTQLSQMHDLAWKAYGIASESKQKGSKGNFVVQGVDIPPPSPNEDLYSKVFPLINHKYDIQIYREELKALHRLPNGKVFFTLAARLPGQNFDKLTRLMNSNPKANVKLYVNIQLFEPYAELFYVARRLKTHKIISNYRLDENGNTFISLSPTTQSFKFIGLEQLTSLQVVFPPQIQDEIKFRREQIKQNEEKSLNLNNEKARKERPNPPPPNPQQSHPAGHRERSDQPPLTGANSTPVIVRAPPHQSRGPRPQSFHPAPARVPPSQDTLRLQQARSQSHSGQPRHLNPNHQTPVQPSVGQPQPTFRFPPPNLGQSPTFPYPPSYWSTPPPGDGVTGTGGTDTVWRGHRPTNQSSVLQHSDPSTHEIEEMVYEQL